MKLDIWPSYVDMILDVMTNNFTVVVLPAFSCCFIFKMITFSRNGLALSCTFSAHGFVVPFLRNSSSVIQSAEYGLFKVVALLKQAISWLVCHFSPGQTVSSCEVYLPAAWCSQPCFGEEGKFGVCGTAEDGCSVAVGITVVGR
jgi:hypothetical protein